MLDSYLLFIFSWNVLPLAFMFMFMLTSCFMKLKKCCRPNKVILVSIKYRNMADHYAHLQIIFIYLLTYLLYLQVKNMQIRKMFQPMIEDNTFNYVLLTNQ